MRAMASTDVTYDAMRSLDPAATLDAYDNCMPSPISCRRALQVIVFLYKSHRCIRPTKHRIGELHCPRARFNDMVPSLLKPVCVELFLFSCELLHCTLAAAQRIVIGPVSLWVCGCVCGSVTTITRNCVHRNPPNLVCR